MKKDRSIMCIGHTGSGKSVLMMHIASELAKEIDIWVVMTPSVDTQNQWRKHLPGCLVWGNYNVGGLQAIIDEQLEWQRKKKKLRRIGIIIDDCTYDKSIFRTNTMRYLLMNGRHLELVPMFGMQYMMDIDPSSRTNIGYIFAFGDNMLKNRKRLHENFFGMFQSYKGFEKAFQTCTPQYECMVMDNTGGHSDHLEKTVYYFKATPPNKLPPFTLCKSVFIKIGKAVTKGRVNNAQRPIGDMGGVQGNGAIAEVAKAPVKKKHSTHSHKKKRHTQAIEPFDIQV